MSRARFPLETVIRDYLIPYRNKHGHLRVPRSYEAADGFKLGQWVATRRAEKKKGKLTDAEIESLAEVGIEWTVVIKNLPVRTVIQRYLIPYLAEKGNLAVPTSYKAPDGFGLGEWVQRRRAAKKAGALPPEDVRALTQVGMIWDVRGLEAWREAARQFYAQKGHLDVPQGYVSPDGTPLGQRLNGAREGLRRGTLLPETKVFLDGLSPTWAAVGRRKADAGQCGVDGCGRPHYARSMCQKHYNQQYQARRRG